MSVWHASPWKIGLGGRGDANERWAGGPCRRVIAVFLAAFAGAVLMAIGSATSTVTAAANAAPYVYDAADIARVGGDAIRAVDAASAQLDAPHAGFASRSVVVRSTPTTPTFAFVATSTVPPRFITTGAGTTIDRAAVGTSISAQRQDRHLAGASQYNCGGYFISIDEAQGVLDAFHGGSAQVLGVTRSGNVVVRVPGLTGFNNNPAAGFVDQATDVFFIKGSSSVSVVPANPNWMPG